MVAKLWLRRPYVRITVMCFSKTVRGRGSRPRVEHLEDRALLANGQAAEGLAAVTDTSTALGIAWQQVLSMQTQTHRSLGTSYRQAQSSLALFLADGSDALERTPSARVKSLRIIEHGQSEAANVLQALVVARGVEDQGIVNYQADLQYGLYTTPGEIVSEAASAGMTSARQGHARVRQLMRELAKLSDLLMAIRPAR